MSDVAALAAIHDTFCVAAVWHQDGQAVSVTVVPFHSAGDDPFGVGGSVRRKGFEIPVAQIAFRPRNGDQIDVSGVLWRVIDVMEYEEALAWRVMVERGG